MHSPRRQRVIDAIRHVRPDRTPKGDLAIEPKLLGALAKAGGFTGENPQHRRLAALRHLNADLAHVHEYPVQAIGTDGEGRPVFRGAFGEEFACAEYGHTLVRRALSEPAEAFDYVAPSLELATTADLDFFRKESDLFVSAQIGGPLSQMDWTLGLEEMMIWCLTDTDAMVAYARAMMEFEVGRALRFLDHGADMILIADDMAYNTGPFLPEACMEPLAWPFYADMIRRIKAHRDVPVFLHTDGDIRTLLDKIVGCGFDGLQSLQPSAGMDIEAVKKQYGDRLCLMGNLDLNRLMPFGTPAEITAEVHRLCRTIGADGGFILSTCNILVDAIPLDNAVAMYRATED
ncbi:MAG: uroporphyrinogen decarboxylase family protein [bacterium]